MNNTTGGNNAGHEAGPTAVPAHELNVGNDDVALTEAHTEPLASPRRLHFYVGALLIAPFLYIALCLVLMRTGFLIYHTQNAYVANMGYGLKLHDKDCQIVIYGDSSAMVGVDPATLQRLTGMTACNIAEFAGMMRLNGNMILDSYLANNARPKYLVITLAPEDFDNTWTSGGEFEAILMRVRRSPDLKFLLVSLRHPEDVLGAVSQAARFAFLGVLHKPLSPAVMHEREAFGGRFPDPREVLTHCLPAPAFQVPSRAYADGFRSRYGVGGTRVIINVTPVPECDTGLNTYEQHFPPGNGIADNQVHTFPVSSYTHSGRLHMSAEGVAHYSQEIASQINAARGETADGRP